MTIKVFQQYLAQTAADADTSLIFSLPVNSTSRFETPLLKIRAVEVNLKWEFARLWVAQSGFNFSLTRSPFTQQGYQKDWIIALPALGVFEGKKIFENNGLDPLVAGTDMIMRIRSQNTGQVNAVSMRIIYEEIVNPTELDLTLGVLI